MVIIGGWVLIMSEVTLYGCAEECEDQVLGEPASGRYRSTSLIRNFNPPKNAIEP